MATSRTLDQWLRTPLGRRCLATEKRIVRRALDRVFGEQLLQIGVWGSPDAFLTHARTQRATLVDWQPGAADVVSRPGDLAIGSDLIDAVLLPHTLELVDSPHALLREVDRVLRADGHLLILSFCPTGLWGLRHMLSHSGYPPGQYRMIREGRLRDWLSLLSFDTEAPRRYCHTLPFERLRRVGTLPREEWAQRWLPFLGGGYLLHAQKQVRPLTLVRPAWREKRLKVVGGLVGPTTRAPHSRKAS